MGKVPAGLPPTHGNKGDGRWVRTACGADVAWQAGRLPVKEKWSHDEPDLHFPGWKLDISSPDSGTGDDLWRSPECITEEVLLLTSHWPWEVPLWNVCKMSWTVLKELSGVCISYLISMWVPKHKLVCAESTRKLLNLQSSFLILTNIL